MPSTWQEPFGLVAIEAMACGTPVIGFDRGSLPELVENGTNGWVVDYQEEEKAKKNGHIVNKNWQQLQKDQFFQFNLERLVSAINQINQLDRKKCRQKFVKRFELEKMADGYEALYQNLIKEK
jgi:glycosyltransferase involved in cell wall biosynthesis